MIQDWQQGPRAIAGGRVHLREVRVGDAEPLLRHLSAEEVCRYIPPPPATVEAFRAFITDSHRRRREGRGCTFAVVPAHEDEAVGLIQLLALDDGLEQWTWGCVLATRHWGTGAFTESADAALDFLFGVAGAKAAEAWVLAEHRRALNALRKLERPAEERRVFGTAPDGRTAEFIVHTTRA